MKRIRLRSALLNGVLLLLAGVAWLYLAPAQVGGFTTYVVTHGVSMEPRFHSGDLALARPADRYKVGDVVAYHSSVLHLVVLHRIVAIHDGRYTFKGDNNDFVDPVRPRRAQLIGKLWIRIPHGGAVLTGLHNPVVDAVACGLLGLFLIWGFGERHQRRRRQRTGPPGPNRQRFPLVTTHQDHDVARPTHFGALLTTMAVAAVVFVVLAAMAFASAASRPLRVNNRYTQQASFGYRAHVSPGPVYPTGTIKTGDPIFLSLVHHLKVHIAYRFTSAAPSNVTGRATVMLNLAGPSGWSRTFVVAPPTRFVGDSTSTDVTVNLRQLETLMAEVERLTGNPAFGAFSFTVEPVVHVTGSLGGQPLSARYEPSLSFQLQSGQLEPSGPPTASASSTGPPSPQAPNYAQSQPGGVGTPGSAASSLDVLGVALEVSLLRWISLLGLALSLGAALFVYLRKRSEPFEESVRIQTKYGHLIVPIVGGEDLGWPPVDVPNIKALVRLAEAGQRLILHNRSNDVDTYMVNEEGTVYRYQVKASKVVWGEWSEKTTPVKAAA